MTNQRKRYSDQELIAFKALITRKLEEAKGTYYELQSSLETSNENTYGNPIRDVDDYSDYA